MHGSKKHPGSEACKSQRSYCLLRKKLAHPQEIPSLIVMYTDIDENTGKLCEEVILNKSDDGVERILEFAEQVKNRRPNLRKGNRGGS